LIASVLPADALPAGSHPTGHRLTDRPRPAHPRDRPVAPDRPAREHLVDALAGIREQTGAREVSARLIGGELEVALRFEADIQGGRP
jgi:hypothetical protein